MPKESAVPTINIDLLKSQGSPQKLIIKAIKWLLSAGRYLIIFVELIVLIAFLTRFVIDAEIENVKDEISKRAPYVEGLKPTEILIKKTQFQLSIIKQLKSSSVKYDEIIQAIAEQTPANVSLNSITLETNPDKIALKMEGNTKDNVELSTFIYGLRTSNNFSDVEIVNVDLGRGILNFSVTGNYVQKK